MRLTLLFRVWVIAWTVILALVPAFAQGKLISVGGSKAAAIVKALEQAHVMSVDSRNGPEFLLLHVDCFVSPGRKSEDSECFLSLNRGHPASVYRGQDAIRIELALEEAGASHENAMGKREISVNALDAATTATFTDALVSPNE